MSYYLDYNKIVKINNNPKRYLKSNEILLNNALDKNFQKILQPFNLMHSIVFLKKYNIRDNFITSNSFKSKVLSFCCLSTMILHFIYLTATDDYSDDSEITKLVLLSFDIIDIVFYPVAMLFLFMHKVNCSNDNVKLVLKLHGIDKVTKLSKTNKTYKIGNWSLGIGLFLYMFVFKLKDVYDDSIGLYDFVFVYCINMNSMYSSRIMKLIKNDIIICNGLLKEKFENSSSNVQFEELHNCYMNVLDAFKIFKKTLRAAVRFFIIFMHESVKSTYRNMHILHSLNQQCLFWACKFLSRDRKSTFPSLKINLV